MKKLLLDMDTGIDDAMAIALALTSDQADLIGITCCFGNVTNETAVRNTLDLLALFGRPDIPVCRGADRPEKADGSFIVSPACRAIHGENGLGNIELPHIGKPCKTPAVPFILDAARRWGEDLTFVLTGTLTNLAAAIRQDRDAVKKIGRIVFMGGALTVAGNVTPYAEANIAGDPEAAKFILESGIPLVMIGLDVTHKALLTREGTARWEKCGVAGRAMSKIVGHYIDHELGAKNCSLHDPLAVAAALDPSIIETHAFAMTAVTEGDARGRTLARSFPEECRIKSTAVALEVDPGFSSRFEAAMTGFFKKRMCEEA